MHDKDMIETVDHWEKWLQERVEKLLRNVEQQEARIAVKQHVKLAMRNIKSDLLNLNN